MNTPLFRQASCMIGASLLIATAVAQTNTFPGTGNVGIGTMAPAQKLDVRDTNGGYVQLNPVDGCIELGSGNDGFSFIDFKGSANLASDSQGRLGFSDGGGFALGNSGGSDSVLSLVSGRTNTYLNLISGSSGDAVGEFSFERTGPAAGNIYIGGNAAGNIVFRSGGYNYRMAIDAAGNVGIGTANPAAKLDIQAAANGVHLMVTGEGGAAYNTVNSVKSDGSTLAPLVARAQSYSFYGSDGKVIMLAGDGMYCRWIQAAGTNSLTLGGGYGVHMTITPSGNVGIGTTNPTNKLEVNGTIRAKEVIVETTGWSDYVFAPDYRLAPLSEVEAHIAAKGTLPGIPSAAEVAEHGVSVGDMQAKLLAKMEEMTLHVIALSKKVDGQATRIAQLEAENAALRAK
jgi:hypothetical protein